MSYYSEDIDLNMLEFNLSVWNRFDFCSIDMFFQNLLISLSFIGIFS